MFLKIALTNREVAAKGSRSLHFCQLKEIAMFKINSKFVVNAALSLLAVLSLVSCSKQEENKPTSGQTTPATASSPGRADASPTPATTSTSSAPAIATADGETPGVRAEVQELKRGSDNTLTLRFAIVNNSDKTIEFGYNFGDEANHIKDYNSIGGVNLIDSVNKKKYFVVRDTESNCVCSRNLNAVPGRSRANVWAKFPAPPDDVQKISVEIPHFGPLDDVPISH
jgi:hypothetical protein